MKRTTTALGAFAAGAALLLTGCGSNTAGSASPAAPASQPSSVAAPTGMSDTGMSDTASSDTGMSDTASSDTASSDTASSDTASSETSSSSEQTSSSQDTSSQDTSSADSSSADTGATTTVGGGGDLDGTSLKWFDTYCTGLSPAFDKLKNISKDMSGAGSDPKKLMKNLSSTFTAMGDAFSGTAKSLDGVPAPTFNGGDKVASTVIKALKEFGPKFAELGKELAKADPSDPKSMEKLQNIGKDLQGVQDLGKLAVDQQTVAAIKQIPSCKPIFAFGG